MVVVYDGHNRAFPRKLLSLTVVVVGVVVVCYKVRIMFDQRISKTYRCFCRSRCRRLVGLWS